MSASGYNRREFGWRDRLRRSAYSERPDPRETRIIVDQGIGAIVGYELADGTIVKAKELLREPARGTALLGRVSGKRSRFAQVASRSRSAA